jgi:hypothetical protein
MNASKAKRRWMKWNRYVSKTGSRTARTNHAGHAKSHEDLMFACRAYPRGVRALYYPKWAVR